MTIWSLTIDTDAGLSTSLHLTEREAYEALARAWFPDADHPASKHTGHRAAFLAAIAEGIDAASVWFKTYLEETGDDGRINVESHTLDWGNLSTAQAAEDLATVPNAAQYIEAARAETDDDLEIDDAPPLSVSDEGCFVAAWVWVGNSTIGIEADEDEDEISCVHCNAVRAEHAQSGQCIQNPEAALFDRVLLPSTYTPKA
jgi:hypothetical protein